MVKIVDYVIRILPCLKKKKTYLACTSPLIMDNPEISKKTQGNIVEKTILGIKKCIDLLKTILNMSSFWEEMSLFPPPTLTCSLNGNVIV